MDSNGVKAKQLGMPYGTACSQLRKLVLFSLLHEFKRNVCFRCGKLIESAADLSMEHKAPWLHDAQPKDKFFDVTNVAFSHLSCNSGAARRPNKAVTEIQIAVKKANYAGRRARWRARSGRH